jgi:hypothetical protein
MLEIFRKLKSGPVSAKALREARAALDPHTVEKTVHKREAARREAILAGDPKAVAAAEAALHDARMEEERLGIAIEELEARIREADAREADEVVMTRVREIEARRDALRRRIVKDVAPALRVTCEVLSEASELDAEIAQFNRELAQKGRPESVALVEDGTTPIPRRVYAAPWTLIGSTVIRPVAAWDVTGFGWSGFAPET